MVYIDKIGAWYSVFPCHRSEVWRRVAAPTFQCQHLLHKALLFFPVFKADLLCLKQAEGQARQDGRNETLSGRVLQLRQRENSGDMLLSMSFNRTFIRRSKSPLSAFPEKERETNKQAEGKGGRRKVLCFGN